ncbi:MAG: LacI family DNA-binding transcriptional regulator [Chitinispirillaceae bacterium]|nr:LacI family DNA-binding transcriptional regulator [Chitinispirillaceae bacterium]
MDIFVDRNSSVPPYLQIKGRILDLIESGVLRENQGIESVRTIAQIAGVSPATAQKAFYELKQQRLIYPKAGSGYFVAKKSQLSNNIFVFLPSSRLTFFTYILDGMFEANQSNDLNIQIYSLDTNKHAWDEKTIDLLRVARNERCSVIFIEEPSGDVRRECLNIAKKVPFVTIEWVLDHSISIVNDYRNAGFKMIDYCVNRRGAESIMVLKGRERQYNARERIIGMQMAAQKYKLVEGENLFFYDTDFDAITAYETIKAHYDVSEKKKAVICANDYEAMGAIGAFLEKQVLVGKDVALIGFGNMIDTVTSYVPLTTMDQQLRLIGIKAVSLIMDLLKNGYDKESRIVTIPTRLVERKT